MQPIPEEVKAKTPCLSLRLRLRASRAKAHPRSRRNSITTRIPFELFRVHSRCTPSEPRISSKNARILLEYPRIHSRTFSWTNISAALSMTCPADASARNWNPTASSSANSKGTPTRKSPGSLVAISASMWPLAPSTIHNFLKVRSLLREQLRVPPFSTPESSPPPVAYQAPSAPPPRTKRDRRPRKPEPSLVLRSVRVLLRFIRAAN